ncbi:MAG TPA: DinB family protein [Propionibacteriaceae bacterium]|nr:DinB family protein [Propionibacteriaceae bacterium]
MPGNPPSVDTEREALVVYLRQQRDGLKNAGYGLTEEQVRLRPTASALTVGGLIKHAASTELGWTQTMIGNPDHATEQTYDDSFSLTDADTLPSIIAEFDRVAAKTEAAVAGLDDLGTKVQLPEAPWLPSDPQGYSARWILLHIMEELARHAGHADIIREQIDGATMYELMAGVEGWPETDWLKPWRAPEPSSEANWPPIGSR